MDERQQQIREGAGLTESKLNVEFIDFLKKYSTPLLLVIAVGSLGYVMYQRVERARAAEVAAAFRELEDASKVDNPSPESLKAIAETYPKVLSVASLARLRAADAYLNAIRLGAKLGARPTPEGKLAAEDVLSDSDRTGYLAEAERLYQSVLDETAPVNGKTIHALSAAYGLAALAESRGEIEKAKSLYERVVQLADRAGYKDQIAIARKRIETLPSIAQSPKLYAEAELPKPPTPEPAPAPAPAPAPGAAPGASSTPPASLELKPPTGILAPSNPPPAQPAAQPGAQPAPAPAAQPVPAPAGQPAPPAGPQPAPAAPPK